MIKEPCVNRVHVASRRSVVDGSISLISYSCLKYLVLNSVSDPYSFDTGPDPIQIQGSDDKNLKTSTDPDTDLLT